MQAEVESQKSDVATLLTTAQAAEYLAVSGETIRRWIENGSLPAKRVGLRGVYRVSKGDLDQMVRVA
jgi:excisionase family DNA binding protein